MFTIRSEFAFYDSANVEIGTIKKKVVKLIGEEFWVENNGVESCVFTGISTNKNIKWS